MRCIAAFADAADAVDYANSEKKAVGDFFL